jgi:hypothetical protein
LGLQVAVHCHLVSKVDSIEKEFAIL